MSEHITPNGGIISGDIAPLGGTSQIGDLYGFAPVTTYIPTYFIYNDYKTEVTSKVAAADGVLSQLTTYSQSSFESLDDARNQLDTTYQLLRDNVVMLWGDLVHGGVGLMNITNTTIGLVLHWGAYVSNATYTLRITLYSRSYDIAITNNGAHQSNLAAIVQPTGTYDNGFCFVNGWEFNRNNSSVTKHNWIGILTDSIACNQSYVDDDTLPIPVYPNVNFTGSVENVVTDWINGFTEELPSTNPIIDKKYWEARALQRKVTTVSYINYEAEPPVEGTSIWGIDNETYNNKPYGPSSTSSGGGGYGNQNRYSEDINWDGVPTDDMVGTGFVSLYNPSKNEMQDFASFLFSSVTDSIANAIKKMIVNPLDGVISAHMIHTRPTTNSMETIKFCGFDTGCQAYVVKPQWGEILYHIHVSEFYNSYHDSKNYTKIKLFVPYAGMKELDIDDFVGGDLWLRYTIDFLSGMCAIDVETSKVQLGSGNVKINSVLYHYTGNCIIQIPMSGIDMRNIFNSVVGIGANAVSGNIGGAIMSGVNGLTQGVNIPKSGDISTNYGYLGYQKPYLLIEHPELSVPNDFDLFEGYPSNITYKLGEIYRKYVVESNKYKEGIFLSIDEGTIWNNYIHCTDKEADMIKQLFVEGVYMTR